MITPNQYGKMVAETGTYYKEEEKEKGGWGRGEADRQRQGDRETERRRELMMLCQEPALLALNTES